MKIPTLHGDVPEVDSKFYFIWTTKKLKQTPTSVICSVYIKIKYLTEQKTGNFYSLNTIIP